MTDYADYVDQIRYSNQFADPNIKVKIPMRGPSNRQTGYGNHFVELVLAMLKLGADVRVNPYFAEPPLPPEFLATMVQPWDFRTPLAIFMANPMRLERIAPHTIGISTWETTRIPPEDLEYPIESQIDEVIVPCKDNIALFNELCPDIPVHYVPEGVDHEFFSPVERDWSPETIKIGMFGALTYRKGIDLGVEAFLDCFANDPKVELHVATTFFELPHFKILPEQYSNIYVHNFGWSTREQVRDFYNGMHALFSPFRGEGFYLPGAEFMATGGCFIAPDKMGPRAYHSDTTGWVIPSHYAPVLHWGQHNGASAKRFGEWLDYDEGAISSVLLDFVNSSPLEKRERSDRASDHVRFSCDPLYAAQKTIDIYLNAYLNNS